MFLSLNYLIGFAQRNKDNFIATEEQVVPYQLPNIFPAETKNLSKEEKITYWESLRKPQVLKLYESLLYGKYPKKGSIKVKDELIEGGSNDGYQREQYILTLQNQSGDTLKIRVLLYLPINQAPKGFVIGLNFLGNHTTTLDPKIILSPSFAEWNNSALARNFKQNEASRGVRQSRWPIHLLMAKGLALVTACYQDFEPDKVVLPKGLKPYGIRRLTETESSLGAIGAWAYGYDLLTEWISSQKKYKDLPIYVSGHSRLGKAALWATAQNPKIKGVLVNGSGRCGASLFRRKFGEPIDVITKNFPHWFLPTFKNQNVDSLPFDQHFLMACVAPRKLMVASATNDWWADPKGEFLSLLNTEAIYGLYEESRFSPEYPQVEKALFSDKRHYHIRRGDHDITYLEWEQFLNWIAP